MGKKNLIIFITLTILVISSGYFFWIRYINDNKLTFNSSGYIIAKKQGNDVKETTVRYYFDKGTTYKKTVNNTITFKDTEEDSVKVDNTTFLHYQDESIGVLKKSVILNLEFIKNSSIVYYNLFSNSTLQKKDNAYYINHLNRTLKFDYFIIKISDSKYLLYAPSMTIKIDDKNNKIENNYLELNLFDGDIVRLENQEYAFQNVSSKMEVQFGNGVVLNLNDKNFYINDEAKLALGNITIDSDDNIEIKETSTTTTKKTTTIVKKTLKKTTSPIGDLGSGKLNSGDDSEKEVNNLEKENIPVYSLSDMEITSSSIYADVTIKDDYSMLLGDSVIKIIDISTGKKVYETNESLLTYNFSIECNSLMQNTSYILTISSEYVRSGVTYTKDFIQKTFRTESIGIDVEKDYATTNKLAFKFIESEFNDVTGVTATLKNGDDSYSINFARVDGKLVAITDNKDFVFDRIGEKELKSNTAYTIVLSNFVFNNSNLSYGQHYVEKTYKTLKSKPIIDTPSYEIDKRNSKFILTPRKIVDKDDGIKKYRYEIYKASDCNVNGCFGSAVKILEKNNASQTDVDVVSSDDAKEDSLIKTVSYVYRIVVEFNDNEKIVEYASSISNIMTLSGVKPPTLAFDEEIVKSESVKGVIVITDEDSTIETTTINGKKYSNFKVTYMNSMGKSKLKNYNIETVNTNNALTIPVDWNNLKSNDTYTVNVYANVNLKDGNIYEDYLIGSFTFNTPLADSLQAMVEIQDNKEEKFRIVFNLKNKDGNNNEDSINISNKLTISLFEGSLMDKTSIGTYTLEDEDSYEYSSTIKSELYDNTVVLTPSSFINKDGNNLSNVDIISGSNYTLKVELTDYTEYENIIPVELSIETFRATSILEKPTDSNNAIRVNTIYNQQLGYAPYEAKEPIEGLNGNTVVGYQIQADFDPLNEKAQKIIYYVHKLNNETGKYEKLSNFSKEIDISDKSKEIDISYSYWLEEVSEENLFTRGYSYFFSYEIITTDGDVWPNEGEIYRSKGDVKPEKQKPIFKIYPQSSGYDDNNLGYYKIKYYYTDIDKAIIDNKIYYTCTIKDNCDVELSSGKYKEASLNNLKTGDVYIHYFQNLIGTIVEEPLLNNLVFDGGLSNMNSISYSIEKDENNIINSKSNLIFNLVMSEEQYNRIVSANVTLNYGENSIVKERLSVEKISSLEGQVSAKVSVNLLDIKDLQGKIITPELTLYYDAGNTGFNYINDDYFIYQRAEDLYYFSGEKYNSFAKNSLFSLKEKNSDLINVEKFKKLTTTIYSGQTFEIPYEINEKGVYNTNSNVYWNPKKISSLNIESSMENSNVVFNDIIPVISVLDENIIEGISNAEIKVNYKGGTDELYENDLTMKYCKVVSGVCDGNWISINAKVKDNSEAIFKLSDLSNNQEYIFNVYGKRKSDDSLVQLIDDKQETVKSYYFKTAENVEVTNFKAEIRAVSFDEKYLDISYSKTDLGGYSGIKYEIYDSNKENILGSWEEINEYSQGNIKTNIITSKKLSDFDGKFTAGKKYYIRLIPYIQNSNGQHIYLDSIEYFEYDFKLLTSAIFDVSYEVTDNLNNIVEFTISCLDISKTIQNEAYTVEIFESNKEEAYHNATYSSGTTKTFKIEYKPNTSYTLKINYNEDLYASLQPVEKIISPLSNFIPSIVNLGEVNLNFIDNKVYLSFEKSSGLEYIKSVVYTNYYKDNNGILQSISNKTISDVKFIQQTLYGKQVFTLELDESAFPDKKSSSLVVVFLDDNDKEIARKNL